MNSLQLATAQTQIRHRLNIDKEIQTKKKIMKLEDWEEKLSNELIV